MLTRSLGEISSSGPVRWKQGDFHPETASSAGTKEKLLFVLIKPKPAWTRQLPKHCVQEPSGFWVKNGLTLPQIQDRRVSQRLAPAQREEKFFPTLRCQEPDSRIMFIERAAKVQSRQAHRNAKRTWTHPAAQCRGLVLVVIFSAECPLGRIGLSDLQAKSSY